MEEAYEVRLGFYEILSDSKETAGLGGSQAPGVSVVRRALDGDPEQRDRRLRRCLL